MNQTIMLPPQVGLATKDNEGLVRKQILPANGVWRWPGQPDKTLQITPQVLDDVERNFNDRVIDTVPFVKVEGGSGAHTEDPESARGVIESLERTDDGLYAHIRPLNDEVAQVMLGTKLGASPSLRFGYKDHGVSGEDRGVVLRHVAWTPEPWISGLKTFEQVAALSAGEDAKDVVFLEDIIEQEGGKEDMSEQMIAELSAKLDEIKAGSDTKIADLSTQLEQVMTEKSELEAKLHAAEAASTAAAIAKTEQEIDVKLSAYVEQGVAPAITAVAKGILMADATNPVTVNLSAGEDEEPTEASLSSQVEAMLDLIPKLSFEELGEGEVKGHVLLSTVEYQKLGLSSGSEGDSDVPDEIREAEELVKKYMPKGE